MQVFFSSSDFYVLVLAYIDDSYLKHLLLIATKW